MNGGGNDYMEPLQEGFQLATLTQLDLKRVIYLLH